jgi:predicted RNA methylase
MATVQMRRIPEDVLAMLDAGYMDRAKDGSGRKVWVMPPLDGGSYPRAKKVINALGIVWDKKLGGHICADGDDPTERIEDAIQTRSYEKPNRLEFFETPRDVINRMLLLADLERGMTVLEPSAGDGAIARVVAELLGRVSVQCIELDRRRAGLLRDEGFTVASGDFLSYTVSDVFDRVLMNPPFRNQADIDHVMRAWEWLKPGGRLVSVMSKSAVFRTTTKARAFQDRLFQFGYHEQLPDESFKHSGTLVSTILVVLDKPEA